MISTTYITAIVVVLSQVLNWLGIPIASEALEQTLTTLTTIGAGLYIMWHRWNKGDITVAGTKK